MQHISTTNLIKRSEPDKTPAGKIIILPSNAANVEYAIQLNHWKTFDWTLTFSEVIAPKNLEIKVANEVTIIANKLDHYFPFFFPNKNAIEPAIIPAYKIAHSVEYK